MHEKRNMKHNKKMIRRILCVLKQYSFVMIVVLNFVGDENETIKSVVESLRTVPLDETGCSSLYESKSITKRGYEKVMTARLASAFDSAKVCDGMAVHVLVAVELKIL